MASTRGAATALLLTAVAHASAAHADLRVDAERLVRAWTASGQRAVRLPPAFLERGRVRPVPVPATATADEAPCTTLALMTARPQDFVVRVERRPRPARRLSESSSERSAAGAVLLSACGASRDALTRVSVELRASRATLETVLATGPRPAQPVGEVLPERASGPVAPPVDTGARAAVAPLAQRAQAALQRAKRGQPTDVRSSTFLAEADGTGHQALPLDEGCHRIDVLGEAVPHRPLDIDAELRDGATDRILARDRGDAVDARLEFCTGTPVAADLLFAGAPGRVGVVMVDRRVAPPSGVPVTWGPRARAGFARALLRRTMPVVDQEPIAQWLGVAGVTPFTFAVQPGTCYVAALATSRGEPRSVSLSVQGEVGAAYDVGAGRDDSAAVAFCATAERMRLEAEVRGSAVAWVAAAWQVGARALEDAR